MTASTRTDLSVLAGEATTPSGRRVPPKLRKLLKNALAAFVLLGSLLGLETGYFSNDRTSRFEWDEMQRLMPGKGKVVYATTFDRDVLAKPEPPFGAWEFYNGAEADMVSIDGGAMVVRFNEAWLGVGFHQYGYEPNAIYRARFEAKVEGQPGAILTRNRQHDLMREQLPVTGGEFKEFTVHYVAPGGRFDQVRLIFMPDSTEKVSGQMTIRKFEIERLGG